MIVGPGIEFASLLALRGAVKLEAVGLRHRFGSATALAKRRYGLKGNRTKVLAELDRLINEYKAAHPPEAAQ